MSLKFKENTMGIFSGCLLASDFDATLTNSEGIVPEEVRAAIRYYIENGGLFTVCTGRTRQGFHVYSPDIINAPVLHANGSMAYDFAKNEVVFLNGIGEENLPAIQYIKDNYDGIGIELYSSDFKSYVINPDPKNIAHFEFQYIDYTVCDEIPREVFPAVKIMIYVGTERCDDFQRFLDKAPMGNLKYIPAHGNFIEIINKNTDKGKGLLQLAEMLGIDKSRAFAVGDGANDVDMLKAAAVGFVPENGDPLAKEAGDVTVKSNDEFAVADVISRIEAIVRN